MTGKKKLFMWTICIVGMVQLMSMAITPALNRIRTAAFPGTALSAIQTVASLPGLVMPAVSFLTAALIRRGLVTKKAVVVTGLFAVSLSGILSLVLHTRLWHFGLLSALQGVGTGCYLSTILSIMFDHFDPEQRREISGRHSVFVNVGAILLSVSGGLLATWRWYGGYLATLVGIPIGILALVAIPGEARRLSGPAAPRSRLSPEVYYYAAVVLFFMMAHGVCGSNLAVHLAAAGTSSSAVAGVLMSFQMVGGALFGLVFGRVSARLRDWLLVAAFGAAALGMALLGIFTMSLPAMFIGVFCIGTALSMLGPQCVYNISNCVDASTSAVATSMVMGLAPGLGSFLSPVVFTNLTTALGGESTGFRYRFVALTLLGLAAILAALTALRAARRQRVGAGGAA